jgi:hypothetical protein
LRAGEVAENQCSSPLSISIGQCAVVAVAQCGFKAFGQALLACHLRTLTRSITTSILCLMFFLSGHFIELDTLRHLRARVQSLARANRRTIGKFAFAFAHGGANIIILVSSGSQHG